ncbi:thioredoxin domain-containing protein [Granulicella arctica]|uniref:Protein-disulfide isomerase n=1 Tax=Granulicella arctica TaxID=940613 RepID=A0A7Y9PID0_9BACT|nr:protein-disulfide isomerase [Granulicella arctica]
MKQAVSSVVLAGCILGTGMMAVAQAAAGAKPAAAPAAPLQLQKLDDQKAPVDPFPAVNPKYFTATTPTVDTVNSFLRALWGYDSNRTWRVAGIQTTAAPGVSKVTVFVSEKAANAKVQSTAFYVMPDGKHAIADGVVNFGATPFAELRKTLQERADGPTRGSASKDLLLVEFSDLQCPHCKEAQGVMDQLVKDFPNARVVYENFPLSSIHPEAYKAAAYGVCVAKKNSDAFFTYAQAVFDTQGALTAEDTDKTLAAAVTKAGQDPAAVATCAATQAAKDELNKQIKLGEDAGVDQTPLLVVNGHILPINAIPYETLKQIVAFQAELDGVASGAGPAGSASALQKRPAPSLSK